ncbi:MAG: ATP-dependent RecD-like DNA helicase [Cyclobacteriaceae bacterium]
MSKPSEVIAAYFPHQPTEGQQKLFTLFDLFLAQKADRKTALLLKGYAGTGKTSVVSALVKALPEFKLKLMLLAPTGRAAKVMASYSERSAFTIHKIIYQRTADPISGRLQFSRRRNYQKNTLYVVDEASMLSNDGGSGRNGLLSDLIDYVFEQPTIRLMLIGDAAQLPPVGQTLSQGLNAEHLEHLYGLDIFETELTEVMRQEQNSGILRNATQLRQQLSQEEFGIQLQTRGFSDVYRMEGRKLEDGLRYAYDKFGKDNTAVICRSNRAAVQYNRFIRQQIFFYDNELEVGDYLMIVKNNYFFTEENSAISFLANGDFVEIIKVFNLEEKHGLRFADLELRLLDYPDQPAFDAKIILDVLHSPSVALEEDKYRELFQQVLEEYEDQETRKQQQEAVRNDLYLNALQVKYAYALTCHKSQGGQWDAVFVDQGYLPDERLTMEYIRWLYTAVTRAKQQLFLMNFREEFFSG